MDEQYILECSGISKAFGGTQALKNVELHVGPGEVHALLGENGAGKSTLMKIIIGLYKQDEGTIKWNGKPYQARGPVDAINQGISMIHQELNPEPHLTIAESIFLKRESTVGRIFLNKKDQNRRAEEVLKQFNFPFGPKTLISRLQLYIQNHYKDKLTLEMLAEREHVSVSLITKQFKLRTGMTVIAYINHIRIEEAKRLLITTNLSITEIAEKCGFNSPKYFHRVFRNYTGFSVGAFRQMKEASIQRIQRDD